ncbi:hypothetical protein AGRA3207_007353 [Actinomadura graeca]|uniref:Uncharacterized protein n=1 Tax=Actinomadura graeca TaxID=2750812 RepID=A0ABX8R423_9ACTN|nr:hypothetical protein [Actinomadura graeca]QXJ25802.1 hypothetical protein AGRA3207_007353 [Actinomadura graeca]
MSAPGWAELDDLPGGWSCSGNAVTMNVSAPRTARTLPGIVPAPCGNGDTSGPLSVDQQRVLLIGALLADGSLLATAVTLRTGQDDTVTTPASPLALGEVQTAQAREQQSQQVGLI